MFAISDIGVYPLKLDMYHPNLTVIFSLGRYVATDSLTGRYVASGSKPRRVLLVFVVKSQRKLRLRRNEKRFDEDSKENPKEDLSEALQVATFKQSNETVGTGGESFLRDENGNEAQAPPSSMPTYRAAPLPDDEAQRRAIFDWAEMKLSEFAGQDSNSNASLKKRREDEIEEERR
uniref:Uncharacterized protein n=1 Tax=Brassica campestris TaxID=3711 RepID=M4FIZ9_BRACM